MSEGDAVMKDETPAAVPAPEPMDTSAAPAETKPTDAPAGDKAEEKKEEKVAKEGEEAEAPKEAEPAEAKEPEKPKEEEELEKDDVPDKRKAFSSAKGAVLTELNNYDAMINTCVAEGHIAQCLDHSFPFLYGGTRATRGVKKGRYYFEVQVVSAGHKFPPEFRVGFSTKGSSLIGGKSAVLFDSQGAVYKGEEKIYTKRFTMEVVGVLLNLNKDSPNANTVSLFLDGVRASKPIALPDELKDVTLYPHVMPRCCALAANFMTPMRPLPFKAKMIDEAPKEDVEDGVKAPKEAEIIIPFGGNCTEWATEFCKTNPDCVLITQDIVKQWSKESGGHNSDRIALIQDSGKTLCRVMNYRKRRYVYAYNSTLNSEDRKDLCKRFTHVKKTCYVNWSADAAVSVDFEKASLPTEEEGFDKVIFEKKKETVEEDLAAWKKRSKLHSVVENFKAGTFLSEKYAEYEALRKAYKNKGKEEPAAETKPAEAKSEAKEDTKSAAPDAGKEGEEKEETKEGEEKPKEGEEKVEAKEGEEAEKKEETVEEKPKKIQTPTDVSEWTEEDWMLADLRVELHLLCHAFREDVEDKERFAFALSFLSHYYRIYYPTKSVRAETYACDSLQDLVTSLMDDTLKVEEQMLLPVRPKDEALEKFIETTEELRNMRTERVGAGDETAALKFKAPNPATQRRGGYGGRPYSNSNHNKGGKGDTPGSERSGRYSNSNRYQQSPGQYNQNRGGYGGQSQSQPQSQFRNYGGYQQQGNRQQQQGGYQQRQPYQQRQYDNSNQGTPYQQRQQYGGDQGRQQYGGDQGRQQQYGGDQGRQQQWGGVKRDYPSGGFQQHQQPRGRY